MAKAASLPEQLDALRAIRQRSAEQIADEDLIRLLASRHNVIVAAGAEMAGEFKRAGLEAKLIEAVARFFKDGAKTDPGCGAKLAIINALCRIDHREPDVYLRGVHHIQKEPSFGRPVDSGGELRGRCAVALAESGYPGALEEVAPLLVDEEPQARVGAARAVGAVGSDGAATVLKLKLLVGDVEPVVLGECCTSLLAIAPERSVEFVAGLLAKAGPDEAAAMTAALAESRNPAALTVLRRLYEDARDEKARLAALQALAVLRVDGVSEYLLDLVEHALHPRAREVVAALAVRRREERFCARLDAALERRDDQLLARYCREVFARSGEISD